MVKEKPKKGYTVQFIILEKDKKKIKKMMRENKDIIVRGIWTENKILMI